MNNVSVITLALAGIAGVFAVLGVDLIGLGGVELVGAGLVLGTVSEVLDRQGA